MEIHGVIHPAVARQIGEDCYDCFGHRRKAACEVLGYSEMPVLVGHDG
ncbi:MAG: ParB N-terminal domain-containing protein [Hungatella sp.]